MGLLFLKNGHKKIAETIGISAIFALFGQPMVRIRGFEPPRKQYSHGPEPCASASSAISAYEACLTEDYFSSIRVFGPFVNKKIQKIYFFARNSC